MGADGVSRAGARTARRADAELNTVRILDAAAACLSRSATASVGEIAQAAGLGRVTVYGHFPSREALVEATLARLLEQGETILAGLDLAGDPREALRALIESSWRLMADAGAVLEAAQSALPPGRIRSCTPSSCGGSRGSSAAVSPREPSAPICPRAGSSACSTMS
jgi:TetR/AcrR family transcriptional regulator, mexCD-oprJ operon repressor